MWNLQEQILKYHHDDNVAKSFFNIRDTFKFFKMPLESLDFDYSWWWCCWFFLTKYHRFMIVHLHLLSFMKTKKYNFEKVYSFYSFLIYSCGVLHGIIFIYCDILFMSFFNEAAFVVKFINWTELKGICFRWGKTYFLLYKN